MKVVCVPPALLKKHASPGAVKIGLYGRSAEPATGVIGRTLVRQLHEYRIVPEPKVWDLLSIALSAVAADASCLRNTSSDGWTRQIELTVAVGDPNLWSAHDALIVKMLRFLTGDLWHIEFVGGNALPKELLDMDEPGLFSQDCACLLSGGMDSLVGMLDLVARKRSLVLASQVSTGDKTHQREFAHLAGDTSAHVQLNHDVHSSGITELSQRSRSLAFLAYGILAATSLDRYAKTEVVDLFVPENGFMSLNVPLTPLRIGSLSTRTTHPHYIGILQALLDNVGLRVRLRNPYQFKTKGEMLVGCLDQSALKKTAFTSTSCSRYRRMGFRHCGRCVPCILRRAAVQAWGQRDQTTYKYGRLGVRDSDHSGFDDVRSVAMAIETVRARGVERWAGASLDSTLLGDTAPYVGLLERAIEEIRAFFSSQGVQ